MSRLSKIPIRIRLTLWYVFLLAVTFASLGAYLILRFKSSLISTVDTSLNNAVAKTVSAIDEEDLLDTGKLSFDTVEKSRIQTTGFAMRLLSPQGDVWDTFGEVEQAPAWEAQAEGFITQNGNVDDDELWRIHTKPVRDAAGQVIGWVQAAQSITAINKTVQDAQDQVMYAIPLVLILAGLGGNFLASRALRPIQQITSTAQEITAQDLSRRLEYRGARDEIGELSDTFDQMIARLQESFQHERRFTSDAAHELRTPLTILKGQLDVTLSLPRKNEEYEAKLRELASQVERLIRLSNDLLFLSRADQKQFSFTHSQVDLNEILEILVEQIKPIADEKKLHVVTQLDETLVIHGDMDNATRLFMNLLDNALKYTPQGGEIIISGTRKPNAVEVAIHNTGIEISEEHLPRLFDRFYRIDSSRASQSGGSGLGLAIAREIVNQHKGRIEAESQPGRGVTIRVEFPLPK